MISVVCTQSIKIICVLCYFTSEVVIQMQRVGWGSGRGKGRGRGRRRRRSVRYRLVSLCVDGAAVNLGIRHGLAALLRGELPWLVAIHCLNHRLELAAKNGFAKTYMDDVSTLLMDMYSVYKNSSKRLRELKELGSSLEDAVRKPKEAPGTRWLQHKSRALKSLIVGYPVICAHLESMASDESSLKPADKAHFKGYLKRLTCIIMYNIYSPVTNHDFSHAGGSI